MIKHVSLCTLLVLGAAAGAPAAQRRSISSAYAALMHRETASGTTTPSGDSARRDLPYSNWSGSYHSPYSDFGYNSSSRTSGTYGSYGDRLSLRHRLAKYRRHRFYTTPTSSATASRPGALSGSAAYRHFDSRVAPRPQLARTKRLGR